MVLWLWLAAFVLLSFSFVIVRGAPYLPTKKHQIDVALDLLALQPNELLVDLGSGDGAVLIAAAKRGQRCVGYELNPILWAIASIRLLPYRKLAKVHFGDFWNVRLPEDTAGVFVFLYTSFMTKLAYKLEHQATRPVRVASFNFMFPDRIPDTSVDNVHLYIFPSEPSRK